MTTLARLRGASGADALVVSCGLVVAFVVGYWGNSHATYAKALAVAPIVVALVCKPQLPLVIGVATLPLQVDVLGGDVHLTVSDLFLTLALAGAIPALLLSPSWRDRLRGTGPLLALATPFAVWLIAVAINHPSLSNALKTGQYYQLFLLPLLLGALVLERRQARWALTGFVAVAIALAILWAATSGDFGLAGNKNPSGQFMADAIVLVLALAPSWTWRIAALIPLVVGLAFTQSRGAVLGAGVGVIAILMLRGLGTWRRTAAAVVPLAFVAWIGYQLVPDDVLARSTDFRTGASGSPIAELSSAQYSIRLREVYREQGWELVEAHPVFGVGPGNYSTGVPGTESYTTDPHDLALRTAGDSGYPGLVAFGLLTVGSAALVVPRVRRNPYAAVAVAVQASLIAHGLVDVYWVRGTPALGWLLIGMAINRRLDRTSAKLERADRGLSRRRATSALPLVTPPRPRGLGYR